MADAVPVSDALCQAIEYLSRLGSNLRVRSENFKQKKLRKDRLRNTHAVQKAANKVLLICELSKKSILNVEDGVKQILTQIDAAQKSKTSVDESAREIAYEYFVFDSQRLKIRNKINLKHYTSVKVLTKAMPPEMENKYPLYYVCNLFHLREQQGTQKCDDHQSTEINMLNNSCTESSSHFSLNNSTEKQDTNILHCEVADKSNNIQNIDSTITIQKDHVENSEIREESPPKKHKKYKNIKFIDDDSDSNDKTNSLPTNENIIENDDVVNTELVEASSTNKDIPIEEEITQENPDMEDTLGENTSKLLSASMSVDKTEKIYNNMINTNEVDRENQTKSYYDHNTNDSLPEIDSVNTDGEKCANNTDNDLLIDSNTNIAKELKSESRSISDDNSYCSTDSRPLIKCVNINKLLKKDKIPKTRESIIEILESDSDDEITVKNKKQRPNKKYKSRTKLLSIKNQINQLSQKCSKDVHDDQDFWNKKRNELKKFKPKQFTVNIVRMPKLTEQFLHKYNLNRIIKNGSVVCEIPLETRNEYLHGIGIQCKSNEKKEVNVVKSALLYDSDSDCGKETVKVNELKKACLDESDTPEEQEKSKSERCNQSSDTSVNKDKQRSTTPVDQVSDNNYNSSDTNTKCRKRKRKSKNSKSPFASKRKCIMKSVHAKKMLLNCSSSSDTDEGVKCVIKDIKNSLLKGESDEDVEMRQKSDSDPEVIKSNKSDSNSLSDLSNKGTSQENNKVNSNNISENLNNENEHIEKTKPKESEDDNNDKISEKSTNKDKQQSETSSEQESDNNDKQKPHKRNVKAKKNSNNCSSSSDTDDKEVENVIKDIKDSLLNWESDEDVDIKQMSDSNKDVTKANKEDSNSECVIPTEDISQKNSNINPYSNSENINNGNENINNENENIEKAKSVESEDDRNSEKRFNKETETSSGQESENNNDSSKSPILCNKKSKKISVKAKNELNNCSSSSDTDDEGIENKIIEMKDSLLKDEVDNETGKKSGSDEELTESNTRSSQSRSNSACDISTSQGNEVNSNSSSEKMGRSKSKPDGSSSQNSDTQESYDKDLDRLTNLKTLSKKRRRLRRRRRRRRSSSSERSQSTSSNSVKKMPKAPLISEDGFLKAETSSDAASLADSDVGEEVEIPAVSMSGLNGDTIDHLAKADLLEQSNSSDSQEKSSIDLKKEYVSDEDNVKSKRRKANAISSDSDAGGSRRKVRGVKLSDFEDSEDDFESTKKSKRKKKKNIDSDASASSSIDASKKKRRRIKHVDDSDDASGSESETEGRNKHGRKNIRKVMGKNQLEEATKKAARQEKERIARIAERQKLYNNLQFDESGKPDEVVLDKVVLDFDPETKEPLIEVDKGLVKKLKPHQANGIKFMWDACFESAKRIKKDKGSGCILAHCMGLGKTLQVVSLTHTLLTHGALTGVRRVLVVCPLSTVLNWVNEFGIWLKHAHADYEVDVYELSRHKQNSERAWQLQQWFSGGGVCVLGYEMFRNLSADNSKKFKKKMLKSFQESLVDPGPDLVVCDEGHLLKNEKTSLSQAMNRVKTLRRIVLTGTPLQNNLKEYYCMVQFVKPNLLGKYNEYLNRFVNPITNGQYTDSTEHDIRIMKRRSHVLHKMLDGAVQRRDYGVLAPFLPPKHEYVLFITLSEVQIKLYQHYLENYSRRPLPGKSSGFLFPDFQSLQRIWTHPLVLKYNSERYEIMQQKKREREEEDSEGSIADFIDDDSTPDESSTEESSDSLSDLSEDSGKKSKKKKSTKKSKAKDTKVTARRGTRANPNADDDDVILEDDVQVKSENPTEWWMSLVTEDELDDLRHSHKLVLLFDILRQCEAIGDKLLVFSQSLYSLDLIEHFLGKVDEATQEARVDEKLNRHVGSWSPGVDYFRLDGSTSCENRSIWCKNFNKEDNPRARLFLISTRAGGLGINLVAANRVVIFDVSWNPSHDVQSIFRVYRFGQKKPCYIYRFLAMGTMEEKIYERQVTKQAISKRVIDEQQIDRHYAENDLAELYKFEPRPPAPRALPPLPKDRLFAEMLREHEAQIYKYHEHDSLLENKEEETLTEEERKAAWEDFENEKTRPPPAPLSYMHNGMMPGLLQQQQQLAYATFAALLHKEMPNASDAQIRDALYRSNPGMFGGYDYGLLQKMGELYKYAQPGMMNPAMMNPAMNAAGGMALGGSSGLQYEPPWQRQQQMRMQQLLQQNQQMGAKLYAGGLGSRDPVAMALQQQRAREMMLGERGRPRGRPRHDAPRALSPADVVNLDSD